VCIVLFVLLCDGFDLLVIVCNSVALLNVCLRGFYCFVCVLIFG